MNGLRLIALIGLLSLIVAACGTATAGGPPDINYGRDICVQCGMIITEEKFATAYEVANGEDLIFDDVGGMVLHLRDTDTAIDGDAAWVHDFETVEWVSAQSAFFVPTLSISSPMGHSILAFADEQRAQSFAADLGADVIDWAMVMALPSIEGLVGHHHMEMGSDTEDHDHDTDG